MPSRLRPTGRFLTPAGWAGLAALALLAMAAGFALVTALPHA